MTSCIYAGSFDPIHNGHIDVITNATKIFDKVYVAPLENKNKKGRFTIAQRSLFLNRCLDKLEYKDKIEVVTFDEMLVDYCYNNKINTILKGVRNINDFTLEQDMAGSIRLINDDVFTLFIPSSTKYQNISSTIVYDVLQNGGDLTPFIPIAIIDTIKEEFGGKNE